MVEAAGVEPASENVVSKEPTYLVTFTRRLSQHSRRSRSERTRNAAASLMISPPPQAADGTSPLCDALSRPADKAGEDGNLTN